MSCVYVYISCYMFLLINLEKNCSSLVLIVFFLHFFSIFFFVKICTKF